MMGNLRQPMNFKRWDQVRVWPFGYSEKSTGLSKVSLSLCGSPATQLSLDFSLLFCLPLIIKKIIIGFVLELACILQLTLIQQGEILVRGSSQNGLVAFSKLSNMKNSLPSKASCSLPALDIWTLVSIPRCLIYLKNYPWYSSLQMLLPYCPHSN